MKGETFNTEGIIEDISKKEYTAKSKIDGSERTGIMARFVINQMEYTTFDTDIINAFKGGEKVWLTYTKVQRGERTYNNIVNIGLDGFPAKEKPVNPYPKREASIEQKKEVDYYADDDINGLMTYLYDLYLDNNDTLTGEGTIKYVKNGVTIELKVDLKKRYENSKAV